MAATINWCEDHGAATGSPARGTTRDGFAADTNYAVNCNWKAADDTNATAYSAASIGPAPDNSYEKFQYLKIGGTFVSIYGMLWTCHGNIEELASPDSLDGRIKLMGAVGIAYTTPSQSVNAALLTDFSRQVWAHQGLPVKFTTTGPEAASPTDTLTAAGYSQYLVSQLQVSASATFAGSETESMRHVFVWTET